MKTRIKQLSSSSSNPPKVKSLPQRSFTESLLASGAMGKRIHDFEWSTTSLGPLASWPQSLQTALSLILQSPVPLVMLWGVDGIMLYNDAYSLFAGARHPFLLGSNVLDGWPEVADFNRNVMKNGLAGKTLSYKDQQLTLNRNNVAEQVWMDLNYSPVMDESGRPAGVLAIVVETTSRVLAEEKQAQAEKALATERDHLQKLFQQSPAAIAVLRGKKHIFELANPLYLQLSGKNESIIGKSVRDAFPEIVGQGFYELLDTVYLTGQSYLGKEIPITLKRENHPEPEELFLNFVYHPLTDDKGNVEGIFAHAVDVTEQVRSRKQIEELSQQKDEFLGIASHELKTPVTSIKAYGQVLQTLFRRSGDVRSVEQLMKMDAQINKLTMLIEDLLDVTKIQSGKLEFHESYFDFNELVAELVDELQLTTEKHHLIKVLGKTKSIMGDRDRIGQVLTNLITNAIKYSPHSQEIIVKTDIEKENVTLCVQDFGVGIPPDKKEKVFEQFFRVSGPSTNTFPGLGLGLYISSEIIKREGGKIWVESEEGKGSTFCFTLPIEKKRLKKFPHSV